MTEQRLPDGFADLEEWIDDWVLEDSQARSDRRQASSMRELHSFYENLLPHAERALLHLSGFRLGELPDAEARLLKLMLSLAEVTPAVEWYRQPAVVDGLAAERFPAIDLLPDIQPPKRR